MAEIVGCLAMSHAPQLMLDPDQWHLLNTRDWDPLPERPELKLETNEDRWRKWQKCQDAIAQLRDKLAELNPDTVVLVGDDQHENFREQGMPPFTVFMGEEAEASISLRYLDEKLSDNRTCYRVDSSLARWLVDQLMEEGFDPAYSLKTSYEGGLGHAFARVLKFLTPDASRAVVPVLVNTYYPPAPSPRRCVQFGHALRKVIAQFPESRRVLAVASGGLTHTKIVESLDHEFIKAIEDNDLTYMERMAPDDLTGGSSEIRNWSVIAAMAGKAGRVIEYQPLYRTTNGVGCAMGFAHWL